VISNNKQANRVIPLLVLVEDLVVFQALKDSKINLGSKAEVAKEDNSLEIYLMSLRSFSEEVNKVVNKEEEEARPKVKILSFNVKLISWMQSMELKNQFNSVE